MIVVSIGLAFVAAALLLSTVADVASLLRILASRAPRSVRVAADQPRLLLLVPAHDEQLLIASCLESLLQQRYPRERFDIVVIADNCGDRTAEIARAAGVQCLERHAPADPGKPQAIAWALSRLQMNEYEATVIVDADTVVDPDFAASLAGAAPLSEKALQPYNGLSNREQNALTRMAAVLSAANHGLAYVLKTRAGLNVPLSAGMCIGSRVLGAHGWTARSLCEDWEMYALLTKRGIRIEGVPRARIHAQEAATLQSSASQRRRWTAGKFTVLAQHAWPLIRSRHVGVAQKLDSLAELSALGPVVQLGLVALTAAIALSLHPPAYPYLAAGLLVTLLRPLVYTVAALGRDPEPVRAIAAFAFLPFYAAWRIGIIVTAPFISNHGRWIRTRRPEPSAVERRA